jgi:cytochrome c oxidase subunit 3
LSERSAYYHSPGGPATQLPTPPDVVPEQTLGATQWGMVSFLVSEAAFFSTLIVAFVTFRDQDTVGPTREVLSLPLAAATTSCLVASSFTIHLATHALGHGRRRLFELWWAATILLGSVFLSGTALEWHTLITRDGLTISRNLLGSTFYMLVGFHALHVTGGILSMAIVLGLSLARRLSDVDTTGPRMVAWYWHFVDVVWLVVFAVVYL